MSTTERSPLSSRYHTSSPSTLEDGMRLAKKRERINSLSPTETTTEEEPAETFEDANALDSPIDFADESTPFYDELMSGGHEDATELAPAESSVATSSSRLAELLRRSATGVEATAERWDDAKDRAKKKLRLFGRAALRATTASSEFALGASMLAANKGLELADRADAAVFTAVDNAKEGAKNTYNAAADKAGDAIMNGFAAVETGMDKAGDKMVDLKKSFKEKQIARKSAALVRRQARHERWNKRVTSAKESVNSGLDRSAELAMAAGAKLETGMDIVGDKLLGAQEAASTKIERTKVSVQTTRAAGRAALDAYRATQRIHAEQNQL